MKPSYWRHRTALATVRARSLKGHFSDTGARKEPATGVHGISPKREGLIHVWVHGCRWSFVSDPPILRHSAGWAVVTAALACAAVGEGYGIAMGNAPRAWVAGSFIVAVLLAGAGAVYTSVFLRRARAAARTAWVVVPASLALNVAVILLALAAALSLRW